MLLFPPRVLLLCFLCMASIHAAGFHALADSEFSQFPDLLQATHLKDVTASPPYATSTAEAMAMHSDGTKYIVGQLRGTVDFDPGGGELIHEDDWGDPYLAIFPPNGMPIVHQFLNDQGGTAGEMKGVELDSAGNAYVFGEFDADVLVVGDGLPDLTGTGHTSFVAKINPQGQVQWAFSLPESPASPYVYALAVNDNRLVIGGEVGSNGADFDPDPTQTTIGAGFSSLDPFIASYDLDGDFLWVRVMQQLVVGQSNDAVEDLVLLENNQLLVAGNFCSETDFDASAAQWVLSSGNTDAFIALFDTAGHPVWVNQMGGVNTELAQAKRMARHNDVIVIHGQMVGAIDFDPDAVDELLISSNPVDSNDYFMAAFDVLGDLAWAHLIDGTGSMTWGDLTVSESGTIALAGSGSNFGGGQIDFDPGPLDSGNTAGGFVALYANDGAYLSAHSFDDVMNVVAKDVLWEGASTLHVSGQFRDPFDVDPGSGVSLLTPGTTSGHEIFFAAFSDLIFESGFD